MILQEPGVSGGGEPFATLREVEEAASAPRGHRRTPSEGGGL